jgi:hypothetical protein
VKIYYPEVTVSAISIIGSIIAKAIKPTINAKNIIINGSNNLFKILITASTCSS